MKLIDLLQGRKWYEVSANGGTATVWECDWGCWHAQLGAAREVDLLQGITMVEGGELSAQLRALELLVLGAAQ